MSLIDFILNIAGILLWINWRAVRIDPLTRATPATLIGTLKRAEPSRLKRWHVLLAFAALIPIRAAIYTQIGPAVDWTPKLNLVLVTIAFRADHFWQELLFNSLSFLRVLIVFHFWLLALELVNWRIKDPDPVLKTVQSHLGRITRFPVWMQAILPALCVALLWAAFYPLLERTGVITKVQSYLHLVGQALLLGGVLYSSLMYLLPAILFLHWIANYVYLGNNPFWDFINTTAGNILKPLNGVRLQYRKVDFAPLVGIALIYWLLGEQRYTLPWIIGRLLGSYNLTIWPL